MTGWQRALRRRAGRIQNIAEIRQAAGMHVLILMRIFVRIRMLDHPASRLCFLDQPRAIAFLQIIADLHARARRRAGLWPEFNFGMRLVSIDGNASDIHFHGADIESANAVEVLHDAGANGLVVGLLLLASAGNENRGEESQGQAYAFHARVFSNSSEMIHSSILRGSKSVWKHWQIIETNAGRIKNGSASQIWFLLRQDSSAASRRTVPFPIATRPRWRRHFRSCSPPHGPCVGTGLFPGLSPFLQPESSV